jgi:prolyl 4-hydroxylase
MIQELDNFLTQKECDTLITLIKRDNIPSLVAGGSGKATQSSSARTSSTCNMPHDNLVVMSLLKKIAMTIGCSTDRIENLQGQLYKEGQEFKQHYDWFGKTDYQQHCMSSGNRTDTLMIYLNEGMEGGTTDFPKLEMSFTPKMGKAIWWKNMINNEVNDEVLHAGTPIIKGKKYIITAWVRENKWDPANDRKLQMEAPKTFSSVEELPALTKNGYEMFKFDDALYQQCVNGIKLVEEQAFTEEYQGKETTQPGSSTIYPIWQVPNLVDKIHKSLLPLMEKWCGEELEPSFIYGFRNYHKGSSLILHRDRIETHHISAIIMMNKDLRCGCQNKDYGEDWALEIQGHNGKNVEVFFEPQDMLFYESAKCEHGRPKPFEGSDFINFYVHYTFKNLKYKA